MIKILTNTLNKCYLISTVQMFGAYKNIIRNPHYVKNSKIQNKPKTNKKTDKKTQQQKPNIVESEPITEQQKKQVLKTYLQIIPPYKLASLLAPDQIDINKYTQIAQNRRLNLQQLNVVLKKVKKNVHIMKVQDLGNFIQAVNKKISITQQNKEMNQSMVNEDPQCRKIITKIQNKAISIVKKKIHILSLEQIINFVYKLVKADKKDFQLMKQLERAIVQQKIPIEYHLIRKLLWSYTHLDAGSSVLYSHISKTIKVGQYELNPLELAQSAYMLSKVSQNAAGGYGVFIVAQKHIQASLPRLPFSELVKAASFLLTQNIGTNTFQCKLQQQIYKKFPDKISLTVNELVSLLKSTSAYYFKFNEAALLHMLKAATERMSQYATLQQFEDIVWSWGRAGKGDRQLWAVIQKLIQQKFIKLLKPRQAAFFYFSMASTQYSSKHCLQLIQNKFLQHIEQSKQMNPFDLVFDHHYILKFLLGMQKRKDYSNKTFLYLTNILCERLSHLSPRQIVSFTKMINQSDLHYQSKQKEQCSHLILQIQKNLTGKAQQDIFKKIYLFNIREVVQLLYMWVKLDISSKNNFIQKLFAHIRHQIANIPKNVFIQALFCHVIKDKYDVALQMIPILYELMKYGPIGYFFSPYKMPLLAYCLYHMQVKSGGSVRINKKLLKDIGQALEQINPSILNSFVLNGYHEALKLKEKYENNQC